MYSNGEAAIARILELVAKCPKELQDKCFEVLLSGYVQAEAGGRVHPPVNAPSQVPPEVQPPPSTESHVPAAVLPRFKNTAKRLNMPIDRLESLFDFSIDPFGLHAVSLPGKNNAEKTRNVALLAAARSYLASGTWSADWQEVKSLCVDHNCYDGNNHVTNLNKGANIFKRIEAGRAIELSSGGIQDAEKLLKSLGAGNPE